MKIGLATSVGLHGALLAFGLLTLSAPPPMDAGQEALPISIVPLSDLTQIQQGDEKAPLAEKAAPTPTERPDIVVDAQNTGENSVDTPEPPTPEPTPKPIETRDIPPPKPKSVDTPIPKPPEPKPSEPEPTPAPESAPEPKEDAKPEPVKEPAPQPEPEPVKQPEPRPEPVKQPEPKPAEPSTDVPLPDSAPSPQPKPGPVKETKPVEQPNRKTSEKPVQEASNQPSNEPNFKGSDSDNINNNKQKPSGGGNKGSKQPPSFGGKKTIGGDKLSQGEMDALREQLGQCWSVPPGMENGSGLRVSIRFKVDASGKVDGQLTVITSSGNTSFDESAMRAIRKCDRQGLNLPADKAEIWSEIVMNFDPSEMF